ncbi:hypothetical protein cand_011950 [Cryptosporidium andersoni]|uniref:FF domain-containing protein n=1 Tax=Cryptosporidium andersoni TaxID=117008 RepID=A0A1J4MGT0_9CRYT|nr:hypothetical protein cand_011950 [Cryptosporidium andersoni]
MAKQDHINNIESETIKLTKEEARIKLKEFFHYKKLNNRLKWDDVLKIVGGDPLYQQFNILSTGEKRQLWSEYQSQAAKRQRELDRQRRSDARKTLDKEIESWIHKNPRLVLKFAEFAKDNYNEWWWKYTSEKEKDDIFQDTVEDYYAKLKEIRKINKSENMRRCLELFRSDEDILHYIDEYTGDYYPMKYLYKNRINILTQDFTGRNIWEFILSKYMNNQILNSVTLTDALEIYINIQKSCINNIKEDLCMIMEKRQVELRNDFWRIIKEDIKAGILIPITETNKNHFTFIEGKGKLRNINFDDIYRNIMKRLGKLNNIQEDYMNFILWHISIPIDLKTICFILKHSVNGKRIYGITLFTYIMNLFQIAYNNIQNLILKKLKQYYIKLNTFEEFKEFVDLKCNISCENLLENVEYKTPFDFEFLIDIFLPIIYKEETLNNNTDESLSPKQYESEYQREKYKHEGRSEYTNTRDYCSNQKYNKRSTYTKEKRSKRYSEYSLSPYSRDYSYRHSYKKPRSRYRSKSPSEYKRRSRSPYYR